VITTAEFVAENPDPRLLFVYGTLRRGSSALMSELLAGEATYVGDATVSGVLYDTGSFPACVPTSDPTQRVHGEVYALRDESAGTLLAQLDQYEGYSPDERYGSLFVREYARVRFDDGSEELAWIYRFNNSLDQARRIPSGDWHQR
jgi:gamma-glutamylcyclotransferase (GGCT)/AIG2-like uncharacterized protein YtfP